MFRSNQVGTATRITAVGATCISSVGNIGIIGVLVAASVSDKATVQVWSGATATQTGNSIALTGIITFVTGVAGAKYLALPVYCSGGACVNITGIADVTLYWNPQ